MKNSRIAVALMCVFALVSCRRQGKLFETPLGDFAQVVALPDREIRVRHFAGGTIMDGEFTPKYEHGVLNCSSSETFIAVCFRRNSKCQQSFLVKDCFLTDGSKRFEPLADTDDLGAQEYGTVGPHVSLQPQLPGDTFLIFRVPKTLRQCDLTYATASTTLDLSSP